MSAEVPYNILGLVLSLLGVVGLVPLVWVAVCHQLPRHRLKRLDSILDETTTLLDTVVQEGLVPSEEFVFESQESLSILRDFTEGLRARVLCADGFCKQFTAAVRGLSGSLNTVCRDVKNLRHRIATASELERRKLASEAGRRSRHSVMEAQNSYASRSAQCEQGATLHEEDGPVLNEGNDCEMPEMHMSPLPAITTPPPLYTAHTPSIQYQSIRHNSSFQDLHQSRVAPQYDDVMCSSPVRPALCELRLASERSTTIRGQRLSSGFVPDSTPTEHASSDDFGPLSDRIQSTSSAQDMIAHRDRVQALIAKVKQKVLADVQDNIACSIQSTLEQHLLGASHPHPRHGDLEAGSCSDSLLYHAAT